MRNRTAMAFLILAMKCGAASLSPVAEQSYEVYVANIEARLARQHAKTETYLAVLVTFPPQSAQ